MKLGRTNHAAWLAFQESSQPDQSLNWCQFDLAYFHRMRTRLVAAGDRGIYAAVMLFGGWEMRRRGKTPKVRDVPANADIHRIQPK
ncbi:MAG: hypothetical protein L0Z50_32275 [Verrucomicrobiales bacterium]|nr:hypothetical protein [Verrucomicrobiales bacterium]